MSATYTGGISEGSSLCDALRCRTAIKLAAASLAAADDPLGEFAATGNQDSGATGRRTASALFG
jgi:hypothetical protein